VNKIIEKERSLKEKEKNFKLENNKQKGSERDVEVHE
jgi:hypothetical protein